jgi:hypothetical protein
MESTINWLQKWIRTVLEIECRNAGSVASYREERTMIEAQMFTLGLLTAAIIFLHFFEDFT